MTKTQYVSRAAMVDYLVTLYYTLEEANGFVEEAARNGVVEVDDHFVLYAQSMHGPFYMWER